MLNSEVKAALKTTIRDLREQLLRDLSDQLDRTYQLAVSIEQATLGLAERERRRRLEAWIDERVRATGASKKDETKKARARFREAAIKEAAYTLLNRLVVLRILEEDGHLKPRVVTGAWSSKGYQEFVAFAPALAKVSEDETEGYALLLRLVMDEWALDLPGLFEDTGVSRLVPVPAATLRDVVQRLDHNSLDPAWRDDTTLGWVYQYWNDPDREALDEKLNARQKLEPHEIASKTQMFTERYIVEWLLQNSLGLMWLAICKKNSWTPDAEPVLAALEERRKDWRARREAGEVELDELMPIAEGLEDRWKYFVPQPMPDKVVETAPPSIRDIKILDPACGSGHFLVIAFELLAALYREEARHTGEMLSDEQIAASILENNLFGVDIDPRAIQIAAAALMLKAKRVASAVRPKHLNLVAPAFDVAGLPKDDPARVTLRERLKQEAGVDGTVTDRLIDALAGVDHLGTLLRIDKPLIDTVMRARNGTDDAGRVIEKALEGFLVSHSNEADLGLRLDGEQIAAGVRFVRMIREGTYDIVVGNPPYQGMKKTEGLGYLKRQYRDAKGDIFAPFMQRSLELARTGGISALIGKRSWMFLKDYVGLRQKLLTQFTLQLLGDLDRGAFEDVLDEVLATAMSVFVRSSSELPKTPVLQPTSLSDSSRDQGRASRKRAALLTQVGRFDFDPRTVDVVEGSPLVYWWSDQFLAEYEAAPKIGAVSPARATQGLYNNTRFTRKWFEVRMDSLRLNGDRSAPTPRWVPFTNGADGAAWFEPLRLVAEWGAHGIAPKLYMSGRTHADVTRFANEQFFFQPRGVAFSMVGRTFDARITLSTGIFGDMGRSIFSETPEDLVVALNGPIAREVMGSLNPTIRFQTGDINRVPIIPPVGAQDIFTHVREVFDQHEVARESAWGFKRPARSSWRYCQRWAYHALNRRDGENLPLWEPEYDDPSAASFVSFSFGVTLGRFDAAGDGLLAEAPDTALPGGIIFLSAATGVDSLNHPAAQPLLDAWKDHGAAIAARSDLRTWLRKSFFAYHKHKDQYDSRPIYFPLSSSRKSFVAWVSIHRWRDDTLTTLLADYLVPERTRLQSASEDVLGALSRDRRSQEAERRRAEIQGYLDELDEFIERVREVAERGPAPTDPKTPEREVDARFEMDLDDGVRINAAALWPLLKPQWGSTPEKWWKEIATEKGPQGKHLDWSHLAARYFPTRVAEKCRTDPSLALTHGCFWRLHPALAYAWELRLQDEIRPDFTIDEDGSDEARARFLAEHPDDAAAIVEKEEVRRRRKANRNGDDAQEALDLDSDVDDEGADDDE